MPTINKAPGQIKEKNKRWPFHSPFERQQTFIDWSAAGMDGRRERFVHELFEAQVEESPETIALAREDQSLSYGELNAQANRLARQLRELGVGPDARVGICVGRSFEMVIAALATLKASGAYVPLDPSYPSGRLAYMIEDSAPMVLLINEEGRTALEWRSYHVPILDLDRDAAQWAAKSRENLDRAEIALEGRNLAYIIYTSGSTGLSPGSSLFHRARRPRSTILLLQF
jgi:non-ribosomal peptide synthetase component F